MVRVLLARVLGGLILIAALTLMAYVVFATIPFNASGLSTPEGWTAEQTREAHHRLGLDRPVVEQWGTYVWGLASRGDFGSTLSLQFDAPVRPILIAAVGPTLSLIVGGFALALLLSLPLGVVSAVRRRTLLDRGILFFTVVGIVLHPFVVGLLLKELLARRAGIAPEGSYCALFAETPVYGPQGLAGSCGGLADWSRHLWLPWLTFAIFFLPMYTRLVRTRVVESMGEQYVLTARAKGASEARVVTRHVFRNAIAPLTAMVAVDVGTIVVAAIYIETIYGLPGIGSLVVHNLSGQYGYDRNMLVGVVVLTAIAITIANVLADFTVRGLDPRTRVRGAL